MKCDDCVFFVKPCYANNFKVTCSSNNEFKPLVNKIICSNFIMKDNSRNKALQNAKLFVKQTNIVNDDRKILINELVNFIKKYNFAFSIYDDKVIIETLYDKWCLLIQKDKIELYHKNNKGDIRHYHNQKQIYNKSSIRNMLNYIKRHNKIQFDRMIFES